MVATESALFYLVLAIVSVIWAFVLNGGWSLGESSSIALFWSWYNIVILTVDLHRMHRATA